MGGLSSYQLKLLAAGFMLVDHIGAIFYPEVVILRVIGRFSFPLFVWLLVQGEAHTRNIWRYGIRLGLLGLVSQPVYQMALDIDRPNILFELLMGLICLRLTRGRLPLQQLAIWLLGAGLSDVLSLSYGSYGIGLIALTRHFQPTWLWALAWVGLHLAWIPLGGPFQLPAIAAPLFFWVANGQRGPKARWFYGFYPGHLLLLALAK